MHWKRFGVLGVLMVKIVIVIFLSIPKGTSWPKTRVLTSITCPNRFTRLIRGPIQRKKKLRLAAILDFHFFSHFFIIGHICWSALESTHVKFDDDRYYGSKVISLYVFHGKCNWKCPKIGVFGDFRGENCNNYLSSPQKAPPWPKTRVLRYYSPKSVYAFD